MSALAGRRIVITRAAHQAAELENLLRIHEAIPLLYPCISIAPPENIIPLNTSLQAAVNGAFDWLVLTSANTVHILRQCFDSRAISPANFTGLKVAAVGSETAKAAIEQLGLQTSLIPEEYTAQALAQVLPIEEGSRVWLPQSVIAHPELAAILSERGARVTTVEAYRTVIGSGGVDLPALLKVGAVDAVTFTSASTVTNLLQRLHDEGGDASYLTRLCLTYIGPKTAAVARQHHLPATVVPTEHTLAGLVTALEHHYMQTTIGESE